MTSFKNAEIKSKKELAQRLINGEVFYYAGFEVYYKEDTRGANPFKLGSSTLHTYWDQYEDMEVKVEWWKNIPEGGRLCFVHNTQKDKKIYAKWIVNKFSRVNEEIYADIVGDYWKYASPVTPEDLV